MKTLKETIIEEVSRLALEYKDAKICTYGNDGLPGIPSINKMLRAGLRLARITANREPLPGNIKALQGAGNDYGIQNSILIVPAKVAIMSGFTMVDIETGTVVNSGDAKDYFVIIDGQTRVYAYYLYGSNFDLKAEFPVLPESGDLDLHKLLRSMNIASFSWKLKDRVKPLTSEKFKNHLVYEEVQKLIDDKWSVAAASIFTTLVDFNSKKFLDNIYLGYVDDIYPYVGQAKLIKDKLIKVMNIDFVKKCKVSRSFLRGLNTVKVCLDDNMTATVNVIMKYLEYLEANDREVKLLEEEELEFESSIKNFYSKEFEIEEKPKPEVYISNPIYKVKIEATEKKLGIRK